MQTTDHAEIAAIAEAACLETLTRRDGIVWSHTVKVRPGQRAATVVELFCCHAVKGWAEATRAALVAAGLKASVGKCRPRYLDCGYGCSSRHSGFEVWISVN